MTNLRDVTSDSLLTVNVPPSSSGEDFASRRSGNGNRDPLNGGIAGRIRGIRKVFLGLSLFFLLLFAVRSITGLLFPEILPSFEVLTPFPSAMVFFLLSGFFQFLIFCDRAKSLFSWFLIIPALGGCWLVLSYFFVFFQQPYSVYEEGGHTLYIQEYRFLFAGEDRLYYRENLWFSRYVGSADQSEECNSSYDIVGDVLIITEMYENGTVRQTHIAFPEADE